MNSNKVRSLILTAIRHIERVRPGVVAWAYIDSGHWELSVNDFDFYMNDATFKKLKELYGRLLGKLGVKIIFVCLMKPNAEALYELELRNNLIMDC